MAVKTEIINNLIKKFKDLGTFKVVERGIEKISNYKKLYFPALFINSYKTEKNDSLSGYQRQVRKLYLALVIVEQTKSDYYERLDELENTVINFIENICQPTDIHSNVLKIEYIDSEEKINDEHLDGLISITILITIDYYEN